MRNLPSASASASASTSKTPCCGKVGLKRGPWTPEEDELLATYVKREGEGRWRTLPKRAGLLRCGKSCRLRWMNYLRPSVKRGQIAPDEEDLILRLHRLLGNRWSLIAGRIPGRTDNEIKNYWNTHLSKKLISQGIDPRTHKPLNPNPNSLELATKSLHSNPSPGNFHVREIGSSKTNENRKSPPPNLDPCHSPVVDNSTENWRCSDGLVTGLRSSHDTSNEDEDDISFCNDDTFSSFLNSLINEDMFGSHHPPPSLPNVIASLAESQPAISSVQTFNGSSSAAWEAASPSSTTAAPGNDPPNL